MGSNSDIEWTDATWNPVTGCTKISAGCKFCYAEVMALRLQRMGQARYANGFDVTLQPDALSLPTTWRKPRRIFVNSMSDLFHKGIPDAYIDRVWAVMCSTSQHTYQVLTKRAERLPEWFDRISTEGPKALDAYAAMARDHHAEHCHAFDGKWGQQVTEPPTPEVRFLYDSAIASGDVETGYRPCYSLAGEFHWRPWPLSNVWIGVSIENHKVLDRIEHLRKIPAAVRFLSIEPLIEALPPLDLTGIGWVIVGGESGPGARPMEPVWVDNIRRDCERQGVPFFFKQWGGIHKHKTGRLLNGRTYDGMPEVPRG